nr:gamma-glutamyl-gamma-aminobutyrate hydrolase family protein [uncultured Janthinobacterium sp.]
MSPPLVLVPACFKPVGPHASHTVQAKYIDALAGGARCMPLIVPALGAGTGVDALLDAAHGLLLTGSPSNVDPALYGGVHGVHSEPLDAARDATMLPLIRAAIGRGMPLLAICRGFQELNVAMGGTLLQAVHEGDGMFDHREDKHATLERQYAPAHRVTLMPDGVLTQLLGGAGELLVNSLHGQGIAMLAPGLQVEARADDGLIEACSVRGARGFALALQWHPEWQWAGNPASIALLGAFGRACQQYRQQNRAAA